jgi:hypothetical protein
MEGLVNIAGVKAEGERKRESARERERERERRGSEVFDSTITPRK